MQMDYATDEQVRELIQKVQFAPPTPAKRGPVRMNPYRAFWLEVCRMLMENPGKWAMVLPDTSMSTVNKIRLGRNDQIDPDVFELTVRAVKNSPKKHVSLYLRFIGENGEFEDVENA
jgi:hypothetical protein